MEHEAGNGARRGAGTGGGAVDGAELSAQPFSHGRADLGAAAERISAAVDRTLSAPATCTADLGGSLGTRAFTAAVIAALD